MMKFQIYKFNSVTSSNDMAINLIKRENKISGCVYTDKQTKGRGTKGQKWISNKGNFFGSLFFPLKKNYPPFNEFSIINAVIISKVIRNFCEKKSINVKWPNDIFVNKKKICGILQEVINFCGLEYLIIGIGINIISNPEIHAKYKATNILSETGNKPSTKEISYLIKSYYEQFFIDLNAYNYLNFKKRADLMTLNQTIK